MSSTELQEMGKLTMFLIAALLPSDALIRFGRNLLFHTVDDPRRRGEVRARHDDRADPRLRALPRRPRAAFFSQVSGDEFAQINEMSRVLIIALLPSDAVGDLVACDLRARWSGRDRE